ncbi:hypothetical protein JHK82_050141 [Glycine max]|nr:hypothetical protein JHK82_050141 [Glycine max]
MASKNKNVPTVVYYDACVADCDNGIEFKGENNVLISMRRGMTFNALKTKIQHKMGLNQDKVVGDFSDHKGEILANNNNNNNDNEDNDIQFLFQPTTIENVYRPYPNSVDVGDNQVPDNLAYRHFFDQQQQSDSHDGKLATYVKLNKYFVDRGTQDDAMIASEQVYTLIAAKFIIEEETKSNPHFVQQFDRQRFQFQVEERVNTR